MELMDQSQDLEASGDLGGALEKARFAVAHDPGNEEVKAIFARLEEDAAKQHSEIWSRRGQSIIRGRGEFKVAADCFRHALEDNPESLTALLALADSLRHLHGEAQTPSDEAERIEIEQDLRAHPKSREARLQLAFSLFQRGLVEEARAILSRINDDDDPPPAGGAAAIA